jgi:hypothetical protein
MLGNRSISVKTDAVASPLLALYLPQRWRGLRRPLRLKPSKAGRRRSMGRWSVPPYRHKSGQRT